jgi:nucleoside-diphosphate-sugar epimerase
LPRGRGCLQVAAPSSRRDWLPCSLLRRRPGSGGAYLDITRLEEDTGYRPEYDVARAVAGYVDWLQAGHER